MTTHTRWYTLAFGVVVFCGSEWTIGFSQTMAIVATRDAQVSENDPDTNLGSDPKMRITSFYSAWEYGNNGRNRVLFGFELPTHPAGQMLDMVTLSIFQTDELYIFPGSFAVYSVVNPWNEMTVTWNNQPAPLSHVGLLPNGAGTYIDCSTDALRQHVVDLYDAGIDSCSFIIAYPNEYYNGTPNGARGDSFASRESINPHPQLTLVWGHCAVDLTTQGAGPSDPLFGVPDGLVTAADINYYVGDWVAGSPAADLTTQGAGVGDPGFGVPDGLVTGIDLQYYVNLWVAGCP